MPKELEKNASPVLKLIDHVWRESFECKAHTWRAFNSVMRSALDLAIMSGMRFDVDDFEYIASNYQFGYWAYSAGTHMWGEEYYATAIIENNIKAAQSFESWKSRKPFVFENTKSKHGYGDMSPRKNSRLFLRCEFQWRGKTVKVTSFSDDGKHIIACSYKEKNADDYSRDVIEKQYKISPRDLKKESKWIKRCATVESKMRLGHTFSNWIYDLCDICTPDKGNRTRDRYFKMILGEK